jgi:hypothetical protein
MNLVTGETIVEIVKAYGTDDDNFEARGLLLNQVITAEEADISDAIKIKKDKLIELIFGKIKDKDNLQDILTNLGLIAEEE